MDCLPKYDKLLKAISDLFFIKATMLNINTTPINVNIGKDAKGPQIHPTTSIFTKKAEIVNMSINRMRCNLLLAGVQSFNKKPKYIVMTIPISRFIR